MNSTEQSAVTISVRKHGPVPEDQVEHAREAVARVLGHVGEPVLETQVTLTVLRDAAVPNPALVQVLVVLRGGSVRAQAASPTTREAIGTACARLAIRLQRVARGWESMGDRSAVPVSG